MSASPQPGASGPDLLTPAAPAPKSGPARANSGASWLTYAGVAPFFGFALLFLLLPTAFLMIGAFQDAQGRFTLANIRELFQPGVLDAYWISVKVSVASSAGGT